MKILELPEGYTEMKRVNLQKDKKLAVLINLEAVIVMFLMVLLGLKLSPDFSFEISLDNPTGLVSAFFLLPAVILYAVCHELVHGFFFKLYSGKKAKYGFTGLYAYAGSDAYFTKKQYLVIGLAPVVFFGIIFLMLNIFLPPQWFWPVYFLQVANISGAAGDAYITYLMCRLPSDILMHDEGFEMVIYTKEKQV